MTVPTVLHLRSTGELLGAESVLLEMVRQGDSKRYHQVIGILHDHRDPYPPLASRAAEYGIPFEIFECRRRLDLKAIGNIRRFARGIRPRILHCHGYREDLYGYLATRPLKPVLVASNHNWLRSNFMLRLYAWLDGRVLRHFDHVVGVSAPIVDEIVAAGISPEKCSLIPNGVSVSPAGDAGSRLPPAASEQLSLNGRTPILGVVASLTPEKGHSYLITAIKDLIPAFPQITLLIIGDGPLRHDLERQSAELGLERNVRFLGTRRDVRSLLTFLDIFVLPSVREGLPMALLEAMSAGKPVVATDVGDVRMALEDGAAGKVVRAGSSAALSTAIAEVCGLPDRGAALAARARRRVEEKFSSRAMARSYMSLYDRLTGSETSDSHSRADT